MVPRLKNHGYPTQWPEKQLNSLKLSLISSILEHVSPPLLIVHRMYFVELKNKE